MVDIPPARNFIVVISFLGIYAVLVTFFAASGLVSENIAVRQPVYNEDQWQLSDIEALSTFHMINCSDGGGYFQEGWGIDEGFGHNFLFKANVVSGEVKIENQHFFYFLWFPHGHHSMDWIAKINGTNYGGFLVQSEFDQVSETDEESNMTSAAFTVQCNHVTMHAVMGYNYTLWNNATEAFQNDDLHIEFGIEWDELGTGLNAWNIISSILFFQAPAIHVYINAILAIPLWACAAWLAYALIAVALSVLPFT